MQMSIFSNTNHSGTVIFNSQINIDIERDYGVQQSFPGLIFVGG